MANAGKLPNRRLGGDDPPQSNAGAGAGPPGLPEPPLIGFKRKRDDEEEADGVDSGSKGLVRKIFGPERGNAMALAAGYGKKYDYRGVLEPTGAKTQCERVVGKFVANTPCYICGLAIPDTRTMDASHELYPECEHILPVTEARWYLDLYMSKSETDPGKWTRDALKLEYAWAHRVCNQAKSNISFVKPNGANLQVNDRGFAEIFNKIKARAKTALSSGDYVGEDGITLRQISNININTRKSAIVDNNITPIIEHTSTEEGLKSLIVLSRTAAVSDDRRMLPDVRLQSVEFAGPSHEEKEAKLDALIDQVYAEYPQFEAERLTTIIFDGAGLLPPEGGWTESDKTAGASKVRSILKTYFDRIGERGGEPGESESTGEYLSVAVFYGVYLDVFHNLHTRLRIKPALSDADAKALCRLFDQLTAFFDRPADGDTRYGDGDRAIAAARIDVLTRVFGESKRGKRDESQGADAGGRPINYDLTKAACTKVRRSERAASRTKGEVVADDTQDSAMMTDEEDDGGTYYFGDLADRLKGIGIDEPTALAIRERAFYNYDSTLNKTEDPQGALNAVVVDIIATLALTRYIDRSADIERVLRDKEGLASPADIAAMNVGDEAGASNAAAGPAGMPGGKRKATRRPLYG